jgi:GNAT superfamily N-acetyltransferase
LPRGGTPASIRAVPTLRVTTWSLEMLAPPSGPARATPPGLALDRVPGPPLHFYRYLYETVGREWLWADRRRLDDAVLGEIIHSPSVEVWLAHERGVPVGFFELDRRCPGEVELAYFGLLPERVGRGLGPWLLEAAIARAWSGPGVSRLWVHTCSLDHPAARRTYERAGFEVFEVVEADHEDPRPLALPPR